jgi:DNA-binding XRE family transcriptional regulator
MANRSRRVPFPFCQITLKAKKPVKDWYSRSFYRQRLKNIGIDLVRRRLKLGVSQTDLAQKIGVHPGTVANWEHSRTLPDVCWLPRIIEFLRYDPLKKNRLMQMFGRDPYHFCHSPLKTAKLQVKSWN